MCMTLDSDELSGVRMETENGLLVGQLIEDKYSEKCSLSWLKMCEHLGSQVSYHLKAISIVYPQAKMSWNNGPPC